MNSTYGTIYKIINKVNGKVYIGVRMKVFNKVQYNINSFLSGTSNKKLKEDVEKYGKTAFELITNIDTANSKQELYEKKLKYIEEYERQDMCYNTRVNSGFDSGERHHLYTPIVLVNTMEVFNTLREANEKYGVLPQNIYACCNYLQKSAGKDKNGKKLLWRYADELDVVLDEEERENYIESQINGEFIYCLNDGKVFATIKQLSEFYNIDEGMVYSNLKGKTSYGGKYKGENLCFVREYKYLTMTDMDKEEMLIKAQVKYHLRNKWIIHTASRSIYKSKTELVKLLGIARPTLDEKIKKGEYMKLQDYEEKFSKIDKPWNFLENTVEHINKVYTRKKADTQKKEYKYICLNTKEKFYKFKDIEKKYPNISANQVSLCCNKRTKSGGKHPVTREKMVWMHYKEYKQMK